MAVHFDAERLQALLKYIGDRLTAVMGNDYAADIKPDAAKGIDQAKSVIIVGDAQVSAAFIPLNIVCRDGDHDLGVFFHLQQHPDFAVRLKARKDTGSMIIIKELSAKLQIQFAAELLNAVADIL